MPCTGLAPSLIWRTGQFAKKRQEQSHYYFCNKYTNKQVTNTFTSCLSNSDGKCAPAYLQPASPIEVQWKTMLLEEEHGYPTRFCVLPLNSSW